MIAGVVRKEARSWRRYGRPAGGISASSPSRCRGERWDALEIGESVDGGQSPPCRGDWQLRRPAKAGDRPYLSPSEPDVQVGPGAVVRSVGAELADIG